MKSTIYNSTVLFLAILVFVGCSEQSPFKVHQKSIKFDSTRAKLSLQYLSDHYGMQQTQPTISPQMIVVHWTAIPTFKKSYDFFYNSRLNPKRKDIEDAGLLNVSTHYMIKRNGQVYQLLADTLFARHVIGLNYTAIGIENVGTKDNRLTDAQLQANTNLIKQLSEKHDIRYLIGHYEYPQFVGHPLWKERDDGYRTEKIDPGREFMKKLRRRVSNLELKGAPITR